jgi:tripartite-type tricarboxylate transporter receptor subunit TctC
MIWTRRLLISTATLAGCARRTAPTGCAALAGQTIRWIVPYGPGGSYDVYSRMLEGPFEKALGAELVIHNETGASSLVGVTKLKDAPPDGLTVGIFNSPGLLAASATGEQGYPDPSRDFAIVGRVSRSRKALVVRAESPLRTVDDLIAAQREKPLLCGVTGVASDNFVNTVVTMSLLGLNARYLFGYSGSREEMLSVLRGEVDFITLNYETLQPAVEAGELRVLLQSAETPLSPHPALKGAGLLAGPSGWAVRRASATGRTESAAAAEAQALVDLIASGIVIAAPKALPAGLLACYRQRFLAATADPAFVAAANKARRTLDVAGGEQAQAVLETAAKSAARFAPLVREAGRKARS